MHFTNMNIQNHYFEIICIHDIYTLNQDRKIRIIVKNIFQIQQRMKAEKSIKIDSRHLALLQPFLDRLY